MKKFELFYCNLCITPSTRPAISFNTNGICSACDNVKKKKKNKLEKKKIRISKSFKKT